MKLSSHLPRTPSRLSNSVHHQLSMYALAASAAGVGALALAQPAEAKIVYTKIHHVIGDPGQYALALDNKTANFLFSATRCPYRNTGCTDNYFAGLGVQALSRGNAVVDVKGSPDFAAALRSGVRISKARNWVSHGALVAECSGFCTYSGQYPLLRAIGSMSPTAISDSSSKSMGIFITAGLV